jgi:hypothetical protein
MITSPNSTRKLQGNGKIVRSLPSSCGKGKTEYKKDVLALPDLSSTGRALRPGKRRHAEIPIYKFAVHASKKRKVASQCV